MTARFPIRSLLLAVLVPALVVVSAGVAQARSAPPVLRAQVNVQGDFVTLGDLFENAGLSSNVAVFRSPELGTQGVVAAARVAAAAERHGLRWVNPGHVEQVTVRRPSRVVGAEEILTLLRDRIAAELGVADLASLEVELQSNARPLHIEPTVTEPLVVKRLHLDMRGGSFHAAVGLQEVGPDTLERTYSGRVTETVEVVAPLRPIERGVTVAAGDIGPLRVARAQLASDAIVDAEALVGMAARRHLPVGRPVRHADVERPKLVQRNGFVTIVYRTSGLLLRSTGRALAEGAMGETVTVLNLQSKRTIHAEVMGPGEVVVRADRPWPTEPTATPRTAAGSRHVVR